MNELVFYTIGFFALLWCIYLKFLRQNRFAFFFWFPFTATVAIGTLFWLWVALMLLPHAPGGDPESGGFAMLGAAVAFGYFLICPLCLAISLWLRPTKEACKFSYIASTASVYTLILVSLLPLASFLDNQLLKITVVDTHSTPIERVKIHYHTHDRSSGFGIPVPSVQGSAFTNDNGQVLIQMPKNHEIECNVTKEGFANCVFRMDRIWGFGVHQCSLSWFGPNASASGEVQFDIPDAKVLEAKLYIPHSGVIEKLPYPPYNPSWAK